MNKEVEFPKAQSVFDDLSWDYEWHQDEAVQDWFKRCIGDFPKILTPEMHMSGDYIWVNPQRAANWFVEWFSQFIEKDEDENG